MGTIIGTYNTAGEAYGSPDIKVMKKSGLCIYYTPFKTLNNDGTDNSVYGTSPDVIVNIARDKLMNCDKLIMQNINYRTYENRLLWDSVLIKTIEIINENENIQLLVS